MQRCAVCKPQCAPMRLIECYVDELAFNGRNACSRVHSAKMVVALRSILMNSLLDRKVVGGDPDKDVAVLQLLDISPEKMRELKPVQLGISSTLMVGQRCV
jgi:hypothetical protein